MYTLVLFKTEYEANKAYVSEADKIGKVSVMYPEDAKFTEKGFVNKQRYVTILTEMWEARNVLAKKVHEHLGRACPADELNYILVGGTN